MFIKFLVSIFGCMFVYRTYCDELRKSVLTKNFLKKWVQTSFFLIFFLNFVFFGNNFAYWCSFLAALAVVHVTIFVTRSRRQSFFREEFENFLDRMVLELQTGRSFYSALHVANIRTHTFVKTKFENLIEAVEFKKKPSVSGQNDFILEIFEELVAIAQSNQNRLQRIRALRTKLKTEDKFRRKSSQRQRNLKTQSTVLVFLYLISLAVILNEFGWKQNKTSILTSLTLFCVGIFWIHRIGKATAWKI